MVESGMGCRGASGILIVLIVLIVLIDKSLLTSMIHLVVSLFPSFYPDRQPLRENNMSFSEVL